MKIPSFMVTLGVVLFTSNVALSQDIVSGWAGPIYGVTTGALTLRESPPSGLFYRKGDAIDILDKGTSLRIEERKILNTIFGQQEWLRVGPAEEDNSSDARSGWVYNGQFETDLGTISPYIEPAPVQGGE